MLPGETPPAAADAKAEAIMQELSHDLMSPYCPGRTIATCPSPNARKLEVQILEQAQEGRSREEIESALVERFPGIRGYVGRPELIWGTAVAALVALTLLFVAGRRWVRGGRSAAAVASPDAAALVRPAAGAPGRAGAAGDRAGGAVGGAAEGAPSRREIDALDDALDRVDEF